MSITMYGGTNVPQIYTDHLNVGVRLPYFYLHGLVQDDNRNDTCKGDINAFYNSLNAGFALCKIHNTDMTQKEGLLFSRYDLDLKRMTGLIVDLRDFDSLREIRNNKSYKNLTIYEHYKDHLRNNHHMAYNILFEEIILQPCFISQIPVLQDNAIKLTETALYRDGGSRDLKDAGGFEYFQDRSIGSRMLAQQNQPSTLGRVYKSNNINEKPWPKPLNIGSYYIEEKDGSHSF